MDLLQGEGVSGGENMVLPLGPGLGMRGQVAGRNWGGDTQVLEVVANSLVNRKKQMEKIPFLLCQVGGLWH